VKQSVQITNLFYVGDLLMKKTISLLIITFLIMSAGVKAEEPDYISQIQPGKWLKNIQVPITYEGETSSARIQIFFPKNYVKGKYHRTVIALHQYGERESDWETNTSIESLANRYNIVIVCPYMNKSLCETAFYPETSYRWSIIPGGRYIGETLISFLNEKFSLAKKSHGTGIMGVTAGARGALLVAAAYNDKFSAAAGISGYYDQSTMPTSRMVESVYGSYKKNQQRWENEDNVLKLAEKLKGVSVYIYHGEKNDAFNPIQSKLMAIRLKQLEKKDSDYSITYKEGKTGGYGWLYWKGQAEPVMEFMNEKLK